MVQNKETAMDRDRFMHYITFMFCQRPDKTEKKYRRKLGRQRKVISVLDVTITVNGVRISLSKQFTYSQS